MSAIGAVPRFTREPNASEERCDLCAAPVTDGHSHLCEVALPRLLCACDPCALLFSERSPARFRRVPRRVEALSDLQIDDGDWAGLAIPHHVAFLFHCSDGGALAVHPSPEGAIEVALPDGGWAALCAKHPTIARFEPDVEALLVRRVGQRRELLRAPIDHCYRLARLLRTYWRGPDGGDEAGRAIDDLFAELKRRAESGG